VRSLAELVRLCRAGRNSGYAARELTRRWTKVQFLVRCGSFRVAPHAAAATGRCSRR
jgi:hypothetical protein